MLLLAVVHKIPESYYNLEVIFASIGLSRINFRLTGDFAFLMPILGLTKGCAGTNPCPLCDQRKTTGGGSGSRWIETEDVSLRTLGSLHSNYNSWVLSGEKMSAVETRKWKGVCSLPLLPLSEEHGRGSDVQILNVIVPGPLHLFLSLNEVINYLEKTQWPEVKKVLQDVAGVQFHTYMGKIGNYEGPSIHKILRNLDKLQPLMNGSKIQPYFTTFKAFKEVAEAIFSTNEIPSDWRRKLHHLKECVLQLHTSFGMNITPMLQILIVHVEQWVDVFGWSLDREGEQQGEAVHHIWK